MGGGGYKYMQVEDANRLAQYINGLGEITRLNADAQEYSYQAQALRANKTIYETEQSLANQLIQTKTEYGVKELALRGQQDKTSTQGKILSNILGQKLTEATGASDLERRGIDYEKAGVDFKQKETSLKSQASELAFNAVATTNDLKEKLYNIRKGVEGSVGKITGSFAERGISSRNAGALISLDLNDRLYRAEIASDSALALISLNQDKVSLLDEQNLLNHKEYELAGKVYGSYQKQYQTETGIQREQLNQNTVNARNDLQLQLQLYNQQADELIAVSGIQAQQSFYDSVVKAYQDEVQARLYEHKATTASQIATNQMQGLELKYRAGEKDVTLISTDGIGV